MKTRLGPISRALAESLRAAKIHDADLAAVELARRYAAMIDAGPDTIADLGPKLLATLTALGMTPAGRGAKGGTVAPVTSALDELRERRARKGRAAAGDGTPP